MTVSRGEKLNNSRAYLTQLSSSLPIYLLTQTVWPITSWNITKTASNMWCLSFSLQYNYIRWPMTLTLLLNTETIVQVERTNYGIISVQNCMDSRTGVYKLLNQLSYIYVLCNKFILMTLLLRQIDKHSSTDPSQRSSKIFPNSHWN